MMFTSGYIDIILLGCFAFMFIFSISLFCLLPSQKSNLYFSILCLLIIIFECQNIFDKFKGFISVLLFILMFYREIIILRKYFETLRENEKNFTEIETINKSERETQLKFLKSQLNPHFIHNALNTIISVSRNDPDESRNLLIEFSRYLRSCFDFSELDSMIPLEKELDFVYSYINIEKARFGNSLNVTYEIDDVKIMIPPFILQPLVENAVIHGIRESYRIGEIVIYVKKMDSEIRIGVLDNGNGMNERELNIILNNTKDSRGIGIDNINQRLRSIYHTNLKFELVSTGGINVYMTLPNKEELL